MHPADIPAASSSPSRPSRRTTTVPSRSKMCSSFGTCTKPDCSDDCKHDNDRDAWADIDDSEPDVAELHGWPCHVRLASQSRQRKLTKVSKRVRAMNADELDALHKMLTSNVNKLISPPLEIAGKYGP